MLRFERNKIIGIEKVDENTLVAHGMLDDDIYSIQMGVTFSLSELEILTIKGWWNRWTTPECPRATDFLKEAVGLRVEEEGFSQKVHKIIGRRACRHFANLLLECSHSAREAALVIRWEERRALDKGLTFEAFLKGGPGETPSPETTAAECAIEACTEEPQPGFPMPKREISGGMVIDLHIHTAPASPCSAAPVDKLINEAKRIGLDGICLTDHNHVWDPEAVDRLRKKHDFVVLRGNEITTDQSDMVVFGLEKDIKGIIKLDDLRKVVLDAKGFMIVAHPFRGFLTFNIGQLGLTPEKAMERTLFKHVDAVEVLNSKVTEDENRLAVAVASGLGLPMTGGSDAHEVSEVGMYATRFKGEINSEKDLIAALKNGEYEPVVFRQGTLSWAFDREVQKGSRRGPCIHGSGR
jgi:predicted metal-dependent phosphoesterase TrpH